MPSSRPLLWSVLQYVTFNSRLTHPFKTPMGALSVVICAILSSIFLKEKLTFFGWLGCSLCIVCPVPFSFTSHLHPSIQIGSVIIALNGMSLPDSSSPVPNPVARAPRTNPFRDIRIQTALHRARLSRLHQCTHRHRTKHHHLFRSKVRPSSSPSPPPHPIFRQVWQEQYDLVHHRLQYDRRHQRQRHNRSWSCYRHHRHGV